MKLARRAHFRAESRLKSTIHQAVVNSDPTATNIEMSTALAISRWFEANMHPV